MSVTSRRSYQASIFYNTINRYLDRDTSSHQATRKYIIISQNSTRTPHRNSFHPFFSSSSFLVAFSSPFFLFLPSLSFFLAGAGGGKGLLPHPHPQLVGGKIATAWYPSFFFYFFLNFPSLYLLFSFFLSISFLP